MRTFSDRGDIETALELLYMSEVQKKNKDITILVVGDPGTAKSSFTFHCCRYLDRLIPPTTYSLQHIAFDHDGWIELEKEAPRQSLVWYDEGRDSFYKRRGMTKNNTAALNHLNKVRMRNHIRFINFQNPADMEKQLLFQHATAVFRCVRQGWVLGYGGPSLDRIDIDKKRGQVDWPDYDMHDGFPDPARTHPELWRRVERMNDATLFEEDEEDDDLGELVSVKEAADTLGVTDRTIRRWAKDGEIDHVRVGPKNMLRIKKEAVMDAVEEA